MNSKSAPPGLSWLAILFVALALSIGWGVRGNWGHEYGAMIPGALAAMAAVLASGRDDWQRRIPFFAFFGAIGWSFGGSISYMQVIAYTHSGHWPTVLYGFACLFLIGFLWAALGGAGTALSAFLDRARLTELLVPTFTVFVAWVLQEVGLKIYFGGLRLFGSEIHEGLREQLQAGKITHEQFVAQIKWLNWNDTDWLAVIVAAAATLLLVLVRRRVCWGTSLVLHMCAGWWLGFTVLTLGLGLRMTPPRGDNWSGALGMTIAMFFFLQRQREWGISWTALVVGWFGGLGFTGATLIKLVLVHPEFQRRAFGSEISTNWHSVLEQTFGFIAGLGVALAMGYLSTRAPRQSDEPPLRRWAEPLCVLFVLLLITYVNIVKNLEAVWLKPGNILAEELSGIATQHWFTLAYLALAVVVTWPLVAWYRGRDIDLLPATRIGKGQLFFIVFLWWIVLGNLSRTVPFADQRLITEGTIHMNACLCTLLVLLLPSRQRMVGAIEWFDWPIVLRKTVVACALGAALVVLGEFGIVRTMWGDTFAGHASLHVRFGPNATLDKK